MGRISLQEGRRESVDEAFAGLPGRYLGSHRAATIEIRLTDVGRSWEVTLEPDRCHVLTPGRDRADATITTDSATWLALRAGRLSGLDCFSQRRLQVRGDSELAIAFEGMFRLPGGRAPLMRVHRVETGAGRLATITAGSGPEHVICIHGLGAAKSSFFTTIAQLAGDRTVHAVDLPGFGNSDKPGLAPYDADFFAGAIHDFMDSMQIDRAHLIGNSMGGRVAIELALQYPHRISSLGLLAPALAFVRKRELWPLVKLLRPELAAVPHPMLDRTVRSTVLGMFADPTRIDPAAADIAVDEFRSGYRSRNARVAFAAAARNIYLDTPHGDSGFYARLRALEPPALFIWGKQDRLVPHGFARHAAEAVIHGEQVMLDDCGHVPQIEHPEVTNGLLEDHIESSAPEPAVAVGGRRSRFGHAPAAART